MTGTILRFNHARGFGFIRPAGLKDDIFFHVSQWQSEHPPEISRGVTFEARQGKRGPVAYNVEPTDFYDFGGVIVEPRR